MLATGYLDDAEARGRALVDQSMLLIGSALQDRLEPHLVRVFGPEWSTEIPLRRGRFARRDLACYAQCLLGSGEQWRDIRVVFREGLGVRMTLHVTRALETAVRVRNRFAHPDTPVAIDETKQDVGYLLVLAKSLNLDCIDHLSAIAREAAALHAGDNNAPPITPLTLRQLQEQTEQAVSQTDLLQRELAKAESERESIHDQLVGTRDELQAANAARDEYEARAASLRKQVTASAANSALVNDLQQQLELAAMQTRAQEERLAESERELAALNERLAAQDRQVDEAARQAEIAESSREDLAGSIAFDQALVEPQQDSLQDLLARLGTLLQQTSGALGQEDEQSLPPPGEPWPFPRGRDVWTLSGARRSLVTYDGTLSLDEVLPAPVVDRLIGSFLDIRPQGGRVWVDDDGDATTYVDGVLTYLGRLSGDSADLQSDDPPLGTPYKPAGRNYTVTTSGIQRTADGVCLADEIGAGKARAILERLLSVRPKGGRFRVHSDGVVTTYRDGGWIFAGRVRPNEWFADDVTT